MLMRHKEEDIYSVNKTLFYVDNILNQLSFAKNIFTYVNIQDLQTDMKTQNDKLANVKYSMDNSPSTSADAFI